MLNKLLGNCLLCVGLFSASVTIAAQNDGQTPVGYWGEISESATGADGTYTLTLAATGMRAMETPMYASWIELGAVWNSRHPDTLQLVLQSASTLSGKSRYTEFHSIEFTVGGQAKMFPISDATQYADFVHNPGSQSTITVSRATVNIDLNYLSTLLAARQCGLTVRYDQAETEAIDFCYARDEYQVGFAVEALRHFYERIKAMASTMP